MVWTRADDETFISDAERFQPDIGLLDSMESGFEEGWAAGPTQALANLATAGGGSKTLTAQQANEQFNLVDTTAAFKDNDDLISEHHAKAVQRRYLQKTSNEIISSAVKEDYGMIGSVANFAGNLGAGFVDPVNLAVGMGTAVAVNKLGLQFGSQALKSIISNKTMGNVFKRQLVENFAAVAITDLTVVPLGEDAINEHISTEARIINVLGGTIMGGMLGTAFELPAIRLAKAQASALAKQHGTQAENIIVKSQEHAAMNLSNGKKPNPDFVIQKMDMEHYNTRPEQTEYVHREITLENRNDHLFYVSKEHKAPAFDNVSDHGSGTITLTDNYNLAHNRVAPIDGSAKGDVFEFTLSKKSNFLADDATYHSIKPQLRDNLKGIFKEARTKLKAKKDVMGLSSKGVADIGVDAQKANQLMANAVDSSMEEAVDIHHFKELLSQKLRTSKGADGLDSIDDFVNKALHDLGFDGYISTATASTIDASHHNVAVLFKKEFFAPETKPKKSLFVHTEPTKVGRSGMVNTEAGEGVFFNTRQLTPVRNMPTQQFDPNHPLATDYMTPIQKLEADEVARMNDPKEDIDYDVESMNELDNNTTVPPKPEGYADAEVPQEAGDLLRKSKGNDEAIAFANKPIEQKIKAAEALFEECMGR